jgi:DNA-binding response OmpR family regulator
MFDRNGAKILIVEDDPSVLDLLTTRLELAGYRTACAKDGYRALEVLNGPQPDAIVLDLNMPNLDGFGVLTALNKRPLDKQPPVLVLTARNAPDDVRRCLSLGAKDYLAKPFKDEQLLSRVARLLRRSNVVSQQSNTHSDNLFL